MTDALTLWEKIESINAELLAGEPGNVTCDPDTKYTGYDAQAIFDAVNHHLGAEHWRYDVVELVNFEGRQWRAHVIISIRQGAEWVPKGLQIGGGVGGKSVPDGAKSAITDGVKKAFSAWSIGNRAYLGLLKMPPPDEGDDSGRHGHSQHDNNQTGSNWSGKGRGKPQRAAGKAAPPPPQTAASAGQPAEPTPPNATAVRSMKYTWWNRMILTPGLTKPNPADPGKQIATKTWYDLATSHGLTPKSSAWTTMDQVATAIELVRQYALEAERDEARKLDETPPPPPAASQQQNLMSTAVRPAPEESRGGLFDK